MDGDGLIIHHDVRVRNHKVAVLKHHTQEVCGLKWSPDGLTLASGGNDNLLCLWDAKASGIASGTGPSVHQQEFVAPRLVMNEHCAAVKALAWCPWQRNLLASGGGTADRTIKFWNTQTGARLNSIDTGSQVCSLLGPRTTRKSCPVMGSAKTAVLVEIPNHDQNQRVDRSPATRFALGDGA